MFPCNVSTCKEDDSKHRLAQLGRSSLFGSQVERSATASDSVLSSRLQFCTGSLASHGSNDPFLIFSLCNAMDLAKQCDIASLSHCKVWAPVGCCASFCLVVPRCHRIPMSESTSSSSSTIEDLSIFRVPSNCVIRGNVEILYQDTVFMKPIKYNFDQRHNFSFTPHSQRGEGSTVES